MLCKSKLNPFSYLIYKITLLLVHRLYHRLQRHLFLLHLSPLPRFLPSHLPQQHLPQKLLHLHLPPSLLVHHRLSVLRLLLHRWLQSLLLRLFQKSLLLTPFHLHHLLLTLRRLRPSPRIQARLRFLQSRLHLKPSLQSLLLHTRSLPGLQSQVRIYQEQSKSFHHRSLWVLKLLHPLYRRLYGHRDSIMHINEKSLRCSKKPGRMKTSGSRPNRRSRAGILFHKKVLKAG